MFVRWKRRAKSRKVRFVPVIVDGKRRWAPAPPGLRKPTGEHLLIAQLVESRRVDGKPRQKVVKHLGSIHESGIPHVGHRVGFWRTAGAALTALGLPDEQHYAIQQALHARVPFPTHEEIAAWRAEMQGAARAIRGET